MEESNKDAKHLKATISLVSSPRFSGSCFGPISNTSTIQQNESQNFEKKFKKFAVFSPITVKHPELGFEFRDVPDDPNPVIGEIV